MLSLIQVAKLEF